MALVIGLCGAKGSGKDYFYHTAKKMYPQLDVRKIAYADPIKNELCQIFELKSELEYDMLKRTPVHFTLADYTKREVAGRHIVREIGMLMRKYDEQQFVRYVEEEIRKAPQALWCITDLRFDNELDSVRNRLDGFVVKIKRPGFVYDGHVTETELSDDVCHSIINNEGSIKHYEKQVQHVLNTIMHTIAIN